MMYSLTIALLCAAIVLLAFGLWYVATSLLAKINRMQSHITRADLRWIELTQAVGKLQWDTRARDDADADPGHEAR
jgi:hypothetical protein